MFIVWVCVQYAYELSKSQYWICWRYFAGDIIPRCYYCLAIFCWRYFFSTPHRTHLLKHFYSNMYEYTTERKAPYCMPCKIQSTAQTILYVLCIYKVWLCMYTRYTIHEDFVYRATNSNLRLIKIQCIAIKNNNFHFCILYLWGLAGLF